MCLEIRGERQVAHEMWPSKAALLLEVRSAVRPHLPHVSHGHKPLS